MTGAAWTPRAACARARTLAALAALAGACAPAPRADDAAAPPPVRPGIDVRAPSGGTLRQDEISVRLSVGDLRIEVTPLVPWVLEAAAPDTRRRLERIAETHADGARSGRASTPFLVSFSSRVPGVEYAPDDVHVSSRGLRRRPVAIRGVTPGWGSHRLDQRVAASAVYVYGDALDLARELVVSYRGTEDASWSDRIAAIEAERSRIRRLNPPRPDFPSAPNRTS